MLEHLALSDSGYLFDSRTGSTYTVNGTGAFLLKALIEDERAERAELIEQLTHAFDVDRATAERDVDLFLYRLKDLGLDAPAAANA